VIVEALACGTPIISADCPYGPAEILEDGRYGLLVPVGDTATFAAAMEQDLRALFPPALLQARALRFSVAECVRRHETLFDALLVSRGRTAFGLSFSGATASSVAAQMSGALPDRVRWIVTPNLEHIRLLRRPSFAASCRAADIVCADGFPIALYAWLRGAAPLSRVTGCDIFHQLALRATQHRRRVLVIAECRETASALVRWIADRGLRELWYVETAKNDLAADTASQQSLVASVRAVRPDILVITLGAPISEDFVARYHPEMPPCWVLCIGQAVRIELGLVRRAPALLRHCGLEWAWRIRQEPARLGARYLHAVAWFPVAVIVDWLWRRRELDDYQREKEGQGSALDSLGP
jgi:N-acetylglucosaminyldiphosphoundecaprenol N-acetyl-beta-D-mannosaminyltransferase